MPPENFPLILLLILCILYQTQATPSFKLSKFKRTHLDLSLIKNTEHSLIKNTLGPDTCGFDCSLDNSCKGFGYRSTPDEACLLIRITGEVQVKSDNIGHFEYYLLDGFQFQDLSGVLPSDCQDILESGLKLVQLAPLYLMIVYCDKLVDGGWLRIQNRFDGSENFYRNWEDYKVGFGKPWGEFWLGNENLHQLTKDGNYTLMIELEDHTGVRLNVTYTPFAVGDESSKYRLTVGGYVGSDPPGDAFGHMDGLPFTTFDMDNDLRNSANCAVQFKGGWWYKSCHLSNLNGLYGSADHGKGISWRQWKAATYSLPSVRMLLQKQN